MTSRPTFWQVLGPGLLFAGSAIGVSHLVQSTSAGAWYGLSYIPLVLLIHALKYPGLSAGPRYAAATGRDLLHGYRAQGRWAVLLCGLVVVGTIVPIQAAVASVSAAVLGAALGPLLPAQLAGWPAALAMQAACAAIIGLGGFTWLDRAMKVLMAVMAVTTLGAAALVLPRIEWAGASAWPWVLAAEAGGLTFLLAFFGWMPAPLDIAIWNSMWSLEKRRTLAGEPDVGLIKLEFLLGYAKCILLAAAFIVLGAALMHAPGITPAPNAGIAAQLLDLYAGALGEWSRPVVGVCAVAVMFSTLLTVTDALPRTAVGVVKALGAAEAAGVPATARRAPVVAVMLGAIAAGTLTIALAGPANFKRLVTVATVTSFLTTPLLAWLNHRCMHSKAVGGPHRPRAWESVWSWLGIAGLLAFAGAYLVQLLWPAL